MLDLWGSLFMVGFAVMPHAIFTVSRIYRSTYMQNTALNINTAVGQI